LYTAVVDAELAGDVLRLMSAASVPTVDGTVHLGVYDPDPPINADKLRVSVPSVKLSEIEHVVIVGFGNVMALATETVVSPPAVARKSTNPTRLVPAVCSTVVAVNDVLVWVVGVVGKEGPVIPHFCER
jgi:hypothetical protein